MWLTSLFIPPFDVSMQVRLFAGIALLMAGIGSTVTGIVTFTRARTTINPFQPASTSVLVTSGIYRITRNPMYLGLLFMLLGWASYLANGAAYLFAPAFILYINRFQITPEERALTAMFGERFTDYMSRVRRWL